MLPNGIDLLVPECVRIFGTLVSECQTFVDGVTPDGLVLGEHREEQSHEEGRDALGAVAAALEPARERRE